MVNPIFRVKTKTCFLITDAGSWHMVLRHQRKTIGGSLLHSVKLIHKLLSKEMSNWNSGGACQLSAKSKKWFCLSPGSKSINRRCCIGTVAPWQGDQQQEGWQQLDTQLGRQQVVLQQVVWQQTGRQQGWQQLDPQLWSWHPGRQ